MNPIPIFCRIIELGDDSATPNRDSIFSFKKTNHGTNPVTRTDTDAQLKRYNFSKEYDRLYFCCALLRPNQQKQLTQGIT